MINKLTVEATIPTVQYGNIKPVIEVEGDDFETIRDEALQAIKGISDMTAGEGFAFELRGLPLASGRTKMVVEDDLVDYKSSLLGKTTKVRNNRGHIGIPGYMSGSKFPDQFYAPFESEKILDAMVKKYGVTAADLLAMWKLNNEASTGYGTAIHAALENYDKNRELGKKVRTSKETKSRGIEYGPNKALSKNPFLKAVVEWFHEVAGDDSKIYTEEFIWDDDFKFCGSVDRIKVIDEANKVIRIQDYKTDGDIHEKKYQLSTSPFKNKMGNELLDLHWLQLSFYAFIMTKCGFKVEGLDVFWLNPNKLVKGQNPWEVFTHGVIDISEAL